MYSGKTLADIAGYSTVFMRDVLLLPRDKWGRLVDPKDVLPPGVDVDDSGMRVIRPENRAPLTKTFQRVKRRQGLDDDAAQRAWDDYLGRNPSLVDLIERCKRRADARRSRRRYRTQPTGA